MQRLDNISTYVSSHAATVRMGALGLYPPPLVCSVTCLYRAASMQPICLQQELSLPQGQPLLHGRCASPTQAVQYNGMSSKRVRGRCPSPTGYAIQWDVFDSKEGNPTTHTWQYHSCKPHVCNDIANDSQPKQLLSEIMRVAKSCTVSTSQHANRQGSAQHPGACFYLYVTGRRINENI